MPATTSASVDKAEKEREATKVTLTWLEKQFNDHGTNPIQELKVDSYLKTLAINQQKIEDTFQRIAAYVDAADLDPHSQEYTSLLDRALELEYQFTLIKNSFKSTSSSSSSSSATSVGTDIRLPRLSLPTFSGKIEEWTSFRDMFTTAIHNNTHLSNSQKLTYLKAQLTGEAARQVQAITITDANYSIAWNQLSDRYQNDRMLLFAILKRFTHQQQLSSVSAPALRAIIDVSRECMRSLEVLSQPVSQWDAIILFLIYQKLDNQTKELYEQSLKDSSIPKLQGLFEFLEQRSRAMEAGGIKTTQQRSLNHFSSSSSSRALTHHTQPSVCPVCTHGHHPLYKCSGFLSLSVPDRIEALKKSHGCFNCLHDGHTKSRCPSSKTCRHCNKGHHSLLHLQKQSESTGESRKEAPAITKHTQEVHSTASKNNLRENDSLLATAVVGALDCHGHPHICRSLVDNCSNRHYITEERFRQLRIPCKSSNVSIQGLGGGFVGVSKGVAWIHISPHFDSTKSMLIKVLIVPKISTKLPIRSFPHKSYPHLQDIQLADPNYHVPGKIDMLLGSEVFYAVLTSGRKVGPAQAPVAISSLLGWLVGGGSEEATSFPRFSPVTFITKSHTQNQISTSVRSDDKTVSREIKSDDSLDTLLLKFWEIESIPYSKSLTEEEQKCEDHFKANYFRNSSGRFVVSLPFKTPRMELGSSLQMSIRRLQYLERRLDKQPNHKRDYIKFMEEYEKLGHMVEVPPLTQECKNHYYIPHHFVLKESSSTTKFRVVFDASAKTTNGISLNDALMVGPTVQDTLTDILMRFRLHRIAFTADVGKMYRQVYVNPSDQNSQRIVWRDDPNKPIKHYQLRTVTYGTAPAPFLATRTLQEIATIQEEKYPLASSIVKKDFYVDDLMSGANSEEEAVTCQQQLITLLEECGFQLRKWTSNSDAVLESLPPEFRETQSLHLVDLDPTVKALGVYWNPATDEFLFKISEPFCKPICNQLTKRELLSQIARLFDPVGWLAPVVICAKMLMQQVWKEGVGWDNQVSTSIQQQWDLFRSGLSNLENLRIPRYHLAGSSLPSPASTHIHVDTKFCLVGFCDASEQAYAAVTYLATYQGLSSSISIINSKTRVAPAKKVSIPRLELCSAVLLSELLVVTNHALQLQIHSVTAWSDSTVVLHWIRGDSSKWKTFVANRVRKIQDRVPIQQWSHVRGVDNPADCASRGIDADTLLTHPLWWSGPQWLRDGVPSPLSVTTDATLSAEVQAEERKEVVCATTIAKTDFSLLHRFSSLAKLIRVTAIIRRFLKAFILKFSKKASEIQPNHSLTTGASEQRIQPGEMTRVGQLTSRRCGLGIARFGDASRSHLVTPLSPMELNEALITWVRLVQHQQFSREINDLSQNQPLTRKSPLLSLHPFLDKDGILRVGGRLRNSDLPLDRKTPMLLPRHDQLTRLIIQSSHLDNLHAGPQLVQATLYKKFWIIRGRDAIRHEIKKCVICARNSARAQQQFMGDLPSARVIPARPFEKCGVDYAGPFLLKPILPRSKTTLKSYLAIFVCFTTRAVHLEIVSDMTTDAFQAALRRFVSRRGKPAQIHSDCGTNFVGASRELKEWFALTKSTDFNHKIADQCSKQGISWHFIPPGSPHFGGLWEAGVKSVKFHLKRILGPHRLTYEQMNTIFIQIEACLNSRPLTAASSDPSDLTALTPGHFLIGCPLTAIPEPDLTTLKIGHLDRWQLLQQINQHFWKRWSSEFLTRLQQRPKWAAAKSDIKTGDLVLIKDERMPPQQWKLARVIQLHPGPDKISRVATLRTADGELQRPFVKLCLLPIDNS